MGKEVSFTPGPWHVEEWDYPDDTAGWTIDSSESHVAVAFDLDQAEVESLANADLIAAAPEMYEVLRYIVECVDKGICDARAQASHARAVLDKVEGR